MLVDSYVSCLQRRGFVKCQSISIHNFVVVRFIKDKFIVEVHTCKYSTWVDCIIMFSAFIYL